MRKLYQITNSLTVIKNKTILPNDDGILNSITFNNNEIELPIEPIPNLT